MGLGMNGSGSGGRVSVLWLAAVGLAALLAVGSTALASAQEHEGSPGEAAEAGQDVIVLEE